MTTQGTPWTAWHLHTATLGAPATDRVVHEVVGPAVDALRQWDAAGAWFFMRYWQFGPHVRLRVAGLDPEHQHHLEGLLRARMTAVLGCAGLPLTAEEYRRHAGPLAAAGEGSGPLETGRLRPGGVYRHRYQPEVERYGGAQLLACSESLFHEASELALAFIRLGPPEAARSGLGLRATWAALDALADDAHRLRFCQRAAAGWQVWAERGGGGKMPAPGPPSRLEGRAPAPVTRWAGQLGQAMSHWRGAADEEGAERILHAHIHMLHNRLGLSVGQEGMHYLALAEWLAPGTVDLAVAR